jgi:hypothetical protein
MVDPFFSTYARGARGVRLLVLLAACLALVVAGAGSALAQGPPPLPPPPPAQPPTPAGSSGASNTGANGSTSSNGAGGGQKPADKNGAAASESTDRLFLILPTFLTVKDVGTVPPMTGGQKFDVATEGSFNYVEFPWYAFAAGVSQENNGEPTLGPGWKGYGKRYVINFADGTSENFLVGAIVPSLLGQDPRYYQMGSGGLLRRAGYAVSRIVVTHTDSGHTQINFSEILGSGAAAALADLYHPQADRTLPNTLKVWRTLVAYDTLTLLLREFWPDIRKAL